MPTVQTNGIETYYERRGSGPPIVFVHGATVDHRQWQPQLDALAEEFTVVAYDVRDHGRTGGSTVEAYSMGLFADDLDALLTALDLDRPIICGLSMGGCIAQTYAATYPESLSGLVSQTRTRRPCWAVVIGSRWPCCERRFRRPGSLASSASRKH